VTAKCTLCVVPTRSPYALCLRVESIPHGLPEDLARQLRVWDLPDAEPAEEEDTLYGRLSEAVDPASWAEPVIHEVTERQAADLAAVPRWEHPADSPAAEAAAQLRKTAARLPEEERPREWFRSSAIAELATADRARAAERKRDEAHQRAAEADRHRQRAEAECDTAQRDQARLAAELAEVRRQLADAQHARQLAEGERDQLRQLAVAETRRADAAEAEARRDQARAARAEQRVTKAEERSEKAEQRADAARDHAEELRAQLEAAWAQHRGSDNK
jgi:hypothetical protein